MNPADYATAKADKSAGLPGLEKAARRIVAKRGARERERLGRACLFPQPFHEKTPSVHSTGREIPAYRELRSEWWTEVVCYGVLGLNAVEVLPSGSVRSVRRSGYDGATFAFQGSFRGGSLV